MQSAVDEDASTRTAAEPLVPAVSRAVLLLERLARQRRPMSASLLAAELALPRSSVHGLCNTLLHHGLLRRQADGFLIGSGVMHLAQAFAADTNVTQEFGEMWRDIGQSPDESVILSVLDGADCVYVAVRNSLRPLGLAFNVGMRLPAHLAGSGKAMLAWLPRATRITASWWVSVPSRASWALLMHMPMPATTAPVASNTGAPNDSTPRRMHSSSRL